MLTETGLVGLGLFLAILALWGRTAWRLASDRGLPDWVRAQGALTVGALGLYVCQALFHELSYLSMDNALLFFLAGITTGSMNKGVGRKGEGGGEECVETEGVLV